MYIKPLKYTGLDAIIYSDTKGGLKGT